MPMLLPEGLESTSGPSRRGRVTGFPQSGGGGEGGRGPETGELQPLGAEHTLEGLDEARLRLLRASHNLGHSRQAQGREAAERAGLEGKGLSQPHSGTLPPQSLPSSSSRSFRADEGAALLPGTSRIVSAAAGEHPFNTPAFNVPQCQL